MNSANQHTKPGSVLTRRPRSTAEISSRFLAGEDCRILSGDFIDAFNRMSTVEKKLAIQTEPDGLAEKDRVFAVSLAATIEELAKESMIPVPSWTKKRKYFLPPSQAMYGTIPEKQADDETREWFSEQSPLSFSKRNLYVSKNSLSRA